VNYGTIYETLPRRQVFALFRGGAFYRRNILLQLLHSPAVKDRTFEPAPAFRQRSACDLLCERMFRVKFIGCENRFVPWTNLLADIAAEDPVMPAQRLAQPCGVGAAFNRLIGNAARCVHQRITQKRAGRACLDAQLAFTAE
jgi:hypothetical protein